MHKTFILLLSLAVCSGVVLAEYRINIFNNNKSKQRSITFPDGARFCICVKNTQTGFVQGVNGGDIKLFSSTDCTGNFAAIGTNGYAKNAQWVNSISFGQPGIPSSGPFDECPDYYYGQ
ncbi:hypothetical protein BGX21_005085 [Mortierella sp. AD011]|nr:hypothetical protein BGX20_002232 [Mortierella sp. AD010]KAF9400050.1 hypothetical protein BGX21_005085 [Mortierella sp. AD011]